ncbi:hypothetical protein L195_g029939 [Trifolium pratense]|uniref:Uncharacterized protein n=1 Tax=Trifolium pratense TaxID=57577 RepID=A0A2K3L663_TRIPR|nr:hypothetical protein L195_g029939 [Trifolium pratense]
MKPVWVWFCSRLLRRRSGYWFGSFHDGCCDRGLFGLKKPFILAVVSQEVVGT